MSSIFNNIIYDEILPYQQKDVLKIMLFVFLGISLTSTIVSFVRQWILIHLSMKIDIPLMLGYFEHIYKLPMKFFASRRTGDITTRFSDAFTIKDIFTNIALSLIMDISMAVITGVILFQMNPKLFAIILFMTVISILLVFIFKQPYKKINEEQMQQASILNSEIIEGLRSVETIKGNANEDVTLEGIEKEYIKSLRISYKEGMLSNIQSTISGVISGLGNLVLLYVGISQVINGDLTLGSYMAFTTLAEYFMEPVSNLVSLQLSIQEANISMRRISEILDYEREIGMDEGSDENNLYQEIDKIDGEINVSNVTFAYGNRKPALKNVSFTIPKGKKVALVGSSGSGKSTMAKLLLKYYEPQEGEITIDGVDIQEYRNDSLRRAISYVPQNIELFSKSIYDNIRISRQSATLEEVFATENIIFDMIYNKFRNKSMLIIAHRLATVKNCDVIIVLDKGEIVEQGTHEELLEKQGEYYRLWEMQQGNIVVKNDSVEKEAEVDIVEEDSDEVISYS